MLNQRIFRKHLNHLVYPKNFSAVQINAIEDNKHSKYNLKSISQASAKFYSNLAESLLKNLPNSPNKFDMYCIHQYYKKLELKDNFNLTLTTEKKVLDILQYIHSSKAAGIDRILGKFLKDDVNILAKPTVEICITSIFLGFFATGCKIAKLKLLYKKRFKTNPKKIRPISLLSFISIKL